MDLQGIGLWNWQRKGRTGVPIYEFVCKECSHRFEELVATMKSRLSAVCPQCGGGASKAISVFSAQVAQQDPGCGPMQESCQMAGQGGCAGRCPHAMG